MSHVKLQPSLRMYLKVYMCLHLVALFANFVLPKFVHIEKRSTSTSSNNHLNITTTTSLSNSVHYDTNNRKINDVCDKIKITTATTTFINNKSTLTDNYMDNNQHITNRFHRTNNQGNAYNNALSKPENNAEIFAKNLANKTRNIEDFFDKTVTGIVDFKDDLMKINALNHLYPTTETTTTNHKLHENCGNINASGIGGNIHSTTSVDQFIKKEIDALNAAVHQANMLPAVLSNGHAK